MNFDSAPALVLSSLAMAASLSGCASAPPPALLTQTPERTPPTHDALLYALEGPYDEVAAMLRGRIERSADCDSDVRPAEPDISSFVEYGGDASMPRVQAWTYGSELACAPVLMCTLAIETRRGWWLAPASEDRLCEGDTGPFASLRVLSEVLERGPSNEVWVRRVLARRVRSYERSPSSGGRVEREEFDLAVESSACAMRQDGTPICQRVVLHEEHFMDLQVLVDETHR